MIRPHPRRWLTFLRVLVLGLVALGFVLQPVLAAAGEMHALAHDPAGTHAHDLHAEAGDPAPSGGEPSEDGAATLHLLLHFAHCCGATAALLPMPAPVPAVAAPGRLAVAKAPALPAMRLSSPFKPPISK